MHHALLYEEALRAVEDLRELEARRAEYISMVSHEIRSPITVIAGIADILQHKRDRLPAEAVDDLIGTLSREGGRLARMVSEVLDLERIDRGGMSVTKNEIDLAILAREAIDDTGEASRVIFERPPTPLVVEADRDKLKQVLINLISNAAKFAPERSPITITLEPADGEIDVGVRDEGPGISDEDKERLFKRFSRLDSTATKPGSGLGLYLSRLIIERHGGRIWVESELGAGTTFHFTLPVS
ncbi:MAG: sensor histidine kinase [Actinomycetota bacterium]